MSFILVFELHCPESCSFQFQIGDLTIAADQWKMKRSGIWNFEFSTNTSSVLSCTLQIEGKVEDEATLKVMEKASKLVIGTYPITITTGTTAMEEITFSTASQHEAFEDSCEAFPAPETDGNNEASFEDDVSMSNAPMVEIEAVPIQRSQPSSQKAVKTFSPERNSMSISKSTSGNYEVEVFFATDRKSFQEKNKIQFGVERGALQYGTVLVSIPKNKELGEVPRPKWWKLEFHENRDKHVMVVDLQVLQQNPFFQQLQQTVLSSNGQDAFVFVHGYNVSFEEAAWRTAQIAYDVKFGGAPILFSWPSRASEDGYFSDEDNVEYSHKHMLQFLKDVKEKTGAKKLHLIAHSMGNRALTRALVELQEEGYFKDFQFTQIILAAPDIDAQIFMNDIAPMLCSAASGRVTLYASEKDKALMASRLLRKQLRRAGDAGKNLVCVHGIDTIDASHVDTDLLGHGYFAQTSTLLNDIGSLLQDGKDPENRGLLPLKKGDAAYWSFKS